MPTPTKNDAAEFPEYERFRAGEFQNGSGPAGGHDPLLVNTEVHISLARKAKDWCAADYFKTKLWEGIAYMHADAKPPSRFRIAWEQGAGADELRTLARARAAQVAA